MSANQVPWKERISYGLGGTAPTLIVTMMSMYLMFFYTDVYGLNTATVAVLFLIAKAVDLFVDPLVGVIIDRTKSRWGKARPYFLRFGIPLGIAGILLFTVPDFGASGKVIYAFVTYIAANVIFSFINIAITAILPNITDDYHERAVVGVIVTILATVGALIVSAFTMPLIEYFGDDDRQKGFFLTMLLFGGVAALLLLNCFANIRERIVQVNKGGQLSLKESVKAMRNQPWILLAVTFLVMNTGGAVKSQSAIYFLRYNIGRPELIASFMTIQMACMLPFMFLSPLFIKLIGKRNTCLSGIIIAILGGLISLMAGTGNITLLYTGNIFCSAGQGLYAGIFSAMLADTIDYGEWKRGIRAQGILSIPLSLGTKLGMGIGGAIGAAVLAVGKYMPNSVLQSPSALTAIKLNFIGISLISGAITFILLLFYRLDKQYPQVSIELKERRAVYNQEI